MTLCNPSLTTSVFGCHLILTFFFSEYKCIQHLRGFGDDELYKFTFYITLHYITVANRREKNWRDWLAPWCGTWRSSAAPECRGHRRATSTCWTAATGDSSRTRGTARCITVATRHHSNARVIMATHVTIATWQHIAIATQATSTCWTMATSDSSQTRACCYHRKTVKKYIFIHQKVILKVQNNKHSNIKYSLYTFS